MNNTNETHQAPNEVPPPSVWLLAMEFRAFWEASTLMPAWPVLRRAPTGDGHPVIVFPGLSASDSSTLPLRHYLSRLNYNVSGWNQGFNFGARAGVLDTVSRQVKDTFEATRKPVSLIGWSLGGVYAREIAKLLPNMVRSVITLGTPFSGSPKSTNAWRIYELTSGRKINGDSTKYDLPGAPPVPTTSILLTQRWHRRLEGQPAKAQRGQPQHREHRSAGQSRRLGAEPQRLVGRGRPSGPAHRSMEAV